MPRHTSLPHRTTPAQRATQAITGWVARWRARRTQWDLIEGRQAVAQLLAEGRPRGGVA